MRIFMQISLKHARLMEEGYDIEVASCFIRISLSFAKL